MAFQRLVGRSRILKPDHYVEIAAEGHTCPAEGTLSRLITRDDLGFKVREERFPSRVGVFGTRIGLCPQIMLHIHFPGTDNRWMGIEVLSET